ncbi:sigma-54-dependent transcriptional regulator [Chondromyces apiculatus]|uniref:Response regulator of zinc sigma-54-dependent two-component system n=1 Tax=Chondromyces apiculatus DSM 436 TaxID=1192034 RepID=A0A017SZ97_9BACT|nr:sigma-54 dependent transcriptional regulator [Chondromyces apiculatus]EYF01611.1 Response regulator of zinc sigma-54-dependent two-component system [Chondromyces apiculatus DSM 436]
MSGIDPSSQAQSDEAAAPTILVVDDERNIRRTLDMVLTGEGFRVVEAASAEDALKLLTQGETPVEMMLVDLMLPGMNGLELLDRVRQDDATRDLPVIVISGHATVHDAVKAIKLGAGDFFEKPLNRERVLVGVRNALKTSRLAREVRDLMAEVHTRYEMIGQGPAMQRMFKEIDRVAPTKASVLITGESGTGKELVSRAIHRLSPRADAPFVKVNCAAIPKELIESELFGHEKGSFTGAIGRKRGLFEQAHGGTLFLDEIGDMELTAQAKVLRALQSGEISRVGSEHVLHVDVRVLAATNKDLSKEVSTGRFREDLFFRLAVFPIRTPVLRERMEDLRPLIDAFLSAFCKENGLPQRRIDPAVYTALERRRWPGNVRELKNVIERAAILSGDMVTVADLPEDPHESPFEEDGSGADSIRAEGGSAGEGGSGERSILPEEGDGRSGAGGDGRRLTLREFRDRSERGYIVEVLSGLDWNISRAAVVLGIERTNLHKKIRAYGIKRGEDAGIRR